MTSLFVAGRVWAEATVLVPGVDSSSSSETCASRVDALVVMSSSSAQYSGNLPEIGFDNLAPIIGHKIANAQYEVGHGSGFLGKPYELTRSSRTTSSTSSSRKNEDTGSRH